MFQYKYERLQDDRSFRLLRLLPGNDPADPIRCQLRVHSLTKDGQIPLYTALSGCFHALSRLRDSLSDETQNLNIPHYFWVDAICINQSDNQEKGEQVRLMHDIYSYAETVLCFIGDASTQEDIYMSNNLKAASGAIQPFLHQDSPDTTKWKADRDIIGADANLRESTIRRLFESRYWTRLWTFQEALLSHRKIVFSGSDIIEWESVGVMLQQAAVAKREDLRQMLPTAIHFHALTTTSPMLRLLLEKRRVTVTKDLSQAFNQSLSLEISRILDFSIELKTSDSRDRIYALTGLMAALEFNVNVDYSRPTTLVYADAISELSLKAYSFGKRTVEAGCVSYVLDLGLGNSFGLRHPLASIISGGISGMNWIIQSDTKQTSEVPHCRESVVDVPKSVAITDTAFNKTVFSIKQEETDLSDDDDRISSAFSLSSSSSRSDELNYASLLYSLASSFLTRKRDWLIARVTARVGPIISRCTMYEGSGGHQQPSSSSDEHASNEENSTRDQTSKKQRRRRDQDEHSGDEGDQGRPRKRNKASDIDDVKKFLACPFYQRDPRRRSIHRSCNGPGWNSISRLKEHLYRNHFVHRCRRCKSGFKAASELESHYQDVNPCAASTDIPDPMDGFNEQQRDKLKCRRMQDWKKIYQVLFPGDDEGSIPSQHYANVIAIADILDQFDDYYQQEIEQLLPPRQRPIIDGQPRGTEPAGQNDILRMVNDIHTRAMQSIRQRMAGVVVDSLGQVPQRDSPEATDSRNGLGLDNPATFFLEYLNHLGHDGSMSHDPLIDPTLGFVDIQNSAMQEHNNEGEFVLSSSPLENPQRLQSDRPNPPFWTQNLGMSSSTGEIGHELTGSGNQDGDWADEWALVERAREGSS